MNNVSDHRRIGVFDLTPEDIGRMTPKDIHAAIRSIRIPEKNAYVLLLEKNILDMTYEEVTMLMPGDLYSKIHSVHKDPRPFHDEASIPAPVTGRKSIFKMTPAEIGKMTANEIHKALTLVDVPLRDYFCKERGALIYLKAHHMITQDGDVTFIRDHEAVFISTQCEGAGVTGVFEKIDMPGEDKPCE